MEPSITPQTENQINEWIRFGSRLAVSAALHPFDYSKVLIQLGYEPIPPRPGKSFFGRPILVLPNIFQYAGYIKNMDGFFGMYRGLYPKLVGSVVGSVCSDKFADKLGFTISSDEKEDSDLTDDEIFERFQDNLKRDVVVHTVGIVVTHPFHVISLRMMAQFVGREEVYSTLFGSCAEIYRNNGLLGFFSGLIPKLMCDLACVVLTSTTVFIINKYFLKEKEARQYCASFTQFVFSSILYPLQVVSTCMTVTGSGLAAGQPPYMPVYANWTDCFSDLKQRGEHKRGSSLFWRSTRGSHAFNKYSYASLPSIAKLTN